MKGQVTEYPGYVICEDGTLISFRPRGRYLTYRGPKIIKPGVTKSGYHKNSFWYNCKQKQDYIHRLVAKAFVPGYFEGAEVHHIDGNKANNHKDNLMWVNREQNMSYVDYSTIKRDSPKES